MTWSQKFAAELGSLGALCWWDMDDVSSGHESWCRKAVAAAWAAAQETAV